MCIQEQAINIKHWKLHIICGKEEYYYACYDVYRQPWLKTQESG